MMLRSTSTRVVVSLIGTLIAVASTATAASGRDEGPLPETGLQRLAGVAAAGSTGGGGNGGNTASTTSRTRTFSSAAYVDYKRRGGEPSNAIDRYPFPGQSSDPKAQCASGQTSCFKDLAYVSAPEGLPGYSFFWKSDDLGASFRLPQHLPATGNNPGQGPGGGDSHQAVGELTHNVFFLDLPGDCITFNRSTDLGESWTTDPLGCGLEPGAIDDRQWVDTDEIGAPGTVSGNVYVSFIDGTNQSQPTLALARSQHDGAQGSFATDSVCNTLTQGQSPSSPANDDEPTACPDPLDEQLNVAGPVVADKQGDRSRSGSHELYIPFIRSTENDAGVPDDKLYIARSTDGAQTWTRRLVADLGAHAADNIFPQLTLDHAGNVYFTWSQTQGSRDASNGGGEQDVFYAYSTDRGTTWSKPIDLTGERGDSAIFPWMQGGDAGQVDLVFYKANTGLNSDLAFVDANGNQCTEGSPGCNPNPSVWNVYFSQSQNALNTGPNFKAIQISDRPNHVGPICTGGTGCENNGGNRNLLDFFTVDVDHLGAAHVVWADDNNSRNFTRNLYSRQLSGSSVYRNTQINLQSSWPTTDHSATDRAGDVFDALGAPEGSCSGMDVLGSSAQRSGDQLTVTLRLNAPPNKAAAIACSNAPVVGATGGLWGAEFWASAPTDPDDPGAPNDNFYVAFVDDLTGPHGELGRVNNFNPTLQSLEFSQKRPATVGGSCVTDPAAQPCTLTLTADLSSLGVKPGAGLYSLTGLSTYLTGTTNQPPFLRVSTGNSEQADAAAPFDVNGTGQTATP
jgi:hypothetical protein